MGSKKSLQKRLWYTYRGVKISKINHKGDFLYVIEWEEKCIYIGAQKTSETTKKAQEKHQFQNILC